MNNGDMPAYPVTNQNGEPVDIGNGVTLIYSTGMTKREAFAMAAMQGLAQRNLELHSDFVDGGVSPIGPQSTYDLIAQDAVNYADALIKALND